jgi:methyl-accepting chemotaxis protein
LRHNLSAVTNNHLPAVRCLGEVRLSAEIFKMARRAMMNPNIDLNDYRLLLDRIAKAQATYESALQTFAALEITPEEAVVWKDFQATWADWRRANDEYFRLAGEIGRILEPCASAQSPNPGRYLNHAITAVRTVGDAAGEFKRLVQAWKNLLLRGDDAEDYSKYRAEIEDRGRRIHASIASLKALAPEIGLEQKPITDAETLCVTVIDKYLAALGGLKTRDTGSLRKLDTKLRGIDRSASAALDDLVASIEPRTQRIQDVCTAVYVHALRTCIPMESKAITVLGKLIDQNIAESDLGAKTAEQSYLTGISVLAIGTAVGVVLAIVLGVVISLGVSRPLSKCVEFANGMAAGDLTRTLDVTRKDEVGQLIAALNTMGANLRQMFANIVENTESLTGSANELSATATQLASGAEETTNQSNTVAAAAEEMSANMNSVSASTEQMSANVRVVASAVEELTSSITEVARSAEQAANVANTAAGLAGDGNARITELGAAASEIGKVIEVIQDIAEQTSLLALNATIEAARAGDAGKGFAVVASEVKELAKQTAAATEDIRRRIEGIQSSTSQAVRSIGDITEVIKKVNEVSRTIASAVEEQSITTREIAKNVAETSTAAQTMARGVAESATVTREIAKNISEVDTAARQTAQGATVAQTASGKVSDVTEQLHALVGQFKTCA